MKILKIVSITLILSLLSLNISFAEYWIYYWTSSTYAKKTYTPFDIMIIQPYNINLYKSYTWKKVCYLSVWEFDGTLDELNTLWLSEAKVWVNSEWNSIIMDMSNLKWQNYLLKKSNELKQMWCNWMFLDTIWNDWQEAWAIQIVKNLKTNWKEAFIIPNNPHYIKNEIFDYIDWAMFENYWDYWTKATSEDGLWYKELSAQYKEEFVDKWKVVYALSYWNPFWTNILRNKWWQEVLNLTNNYWFGLIFSDYNLTKIYGYKKLNKLIQFK